MSGNLIYRILPCLNSAPSDMRRQNEVFAGVVQPWIAIDRTPSIRSGTSAAGVLSKAVKSSTTSASGDGSSSAASMVPKSRKTAFMIYRLFFL